MRYPPDNTAAPTTLFVTEMPAFWNSDQLMAMLQSKGVVINATSPTTSTSLFVTILLGFGPTLLIVLLFVLFIGSMRRAAGGITGGIGAIGRSRAQRVEPSEQTESPSRTSPGSTRPRQS